MKKDIIILAAGVGSRLRPLTDSVPKTMVKVNGESIIERLLKQIDAVEGVEKNVKIVAGYKYDILKNYVEKLGIKLEFIINKDFDKTNNMYSLHLALKSLKGNNDLVIINADCFYDENIVSEMITAKGDYIAIDKSSYSDESMKVKLDTNGQVSQMAKSLLENDDVFVSIDLYTFSDKTKQQIQAIVQTFIDAKDLNSWTEVAIDVLAKREESEIGVVDFSKSRWMEIDNHEDLKTAETIFA